jgi:GNAT superfamily N-acetyltransferase
MQPFAIRLATPADLPGLWAVRYAVRENTLTPGRITDAELIASITTTGRGFIAERDGALGGFVIGLNSGEVWALFVDPALESLGIGSSLHATLLDWYATLPPKTLWLNTGAVTRARRFYERRGWRVIGVHGNDEVRLERDSVEC